MILSDLFDHLFADFFATPEQRHVARLNGERAVIDARRGIVESRAALDRACEQIAYDAALWRQRALRTLERDRIEAEQELQRLQIGGRRETLRQARALANEEYEFSLTQALRMLPLDARLQVLRGEIETEKLLAARSALQRFRRTLDSGGNLTASDIASVLRVLVQPQTAGPQRMLPERAAPALAAYRDDDQLDGMARQIAASVADDPDPEATLDEFKSAVRSRLSDDPLAADEVIRRAERYIQAHF